MTEHGARILLVDDENAILQLIEPFLTSLGYDVEATDEPTRALEAATGADGGFDLLIADIQMPGMLGHELANQIREESPELGVILITGDSTASIDVSSRVRFLRKPFSLRSLRDTVANVLAAEAAERSAAQISVYFDSSQDLVTGRVLGAAVEPVRCEHCDPRGRDTVRQLLL